MMQPGAFLPQLLADAHVEFQVNWTRLVVTVTVFLALAGFALYLETRSAQKNKKK